MYGHDGMDEGMNSKATSLRDLILEMKKLHAEGLNGKPKGVALEVHESHLEPLSPEAEHELEESPEHEAEESPEEEAAEHEDEECEDEGEEPEMHIPEGLLRLIAEKLAK